jgi:hypothetical protein
MRPREMNLASTEQGDMVPSRRVESTRRRGGVMD